MISEGPFSHGCDARIRPPVLVNWPAASLGDLRGLHPERLQPCSRLQPHTAATASIGRLALPRERNGTAMLEAIMTFKN